MRVRRFVDDEVIPAERQILAENEAGERTTIRALQAKARQEEPWTPPNPSVVMAGLFFMSGFAALANEVLRLTAP